MIIWVDRVARWTTVGMVLVKVVNDLWRWRRSMKFWQHYDTSDIDVLLQKTPPDWRCTRLTKGG